MGELSGEENLESGEENCGSGDLVSSVAQDPGPGESSGERSRREQPRPWNMPWQDYKMYIKGHDPTGMRTLRLNWKRTGREVEEGAGGGSMGREANACGWSTQDYVLWA